MTSSAALARLLVRGGFPEPCLAESDTDADRWRAQYATDLVEVKFSDATPSPYLYRMAERLAPARAVQIVLELWQVAQHGRIEVTHADQWLSSLAA